MTVQLSHTSKPKKSEAFDMILSLKNGRILPTEDLDYLLNYFAPPLPKKAKTAFSWVAKACNSKDVRAMCHYVHVIKGVANATDGHRIHWAKVDLPDGVYDPLTGLEVIDSGVTVPGNLEMVKAEAKDLEQGLLSHFNDIVLEGNRFCPRAMEKNGSTFNKQYVMDACNGTLEVQVRFSSDKLHGVSEFGSFAMMGIRT